MLLTELMVVEVECFRERGVGAYIAWLFVDLGLCRCCCCVIIFFASLLLKFPVQKMS